MFENCGFLFENTLALRFEGSEGTRALFGFEYNEFRVKITPEKGVKGRLIVCDYGCQVPQQNCDFSLDEWNTYKPGIITRQKYILQKFDEAFDHLPMNFESDIRGWALGDIAGQLEEMFELIEKED